jgi:hypothetical protein
MIINIHRRKTPNRGDLASTPLLYTANAESVKYIDILECYIENIKIEEVLRHAELIIIGGGGLLDNPKFAPHVDFLLEGFHDKIVIWGIGTNTVNAKSTPSNLNRLDLFGLRDFYSQDSPFPNSTWVPCASCMNLEIDAIMQRRKTLATSSIGILINDSGKIPMRIGNCSVSELRFFGNKKVRTIEMLEFIMSSRVLVTNSYHAAYWATLMMIPVLAVPTSSKFKYFKHPVPLAGKDDWINYIRDTRVYPYALEDCRISNKEFLEKINFKFSRNPPLKFN